MFFQKIYGRQPNNASDGIASYGSDPDDGA